VGPLADPSRAGVRADFEADGVAMGSPPAFCCAAYEPVAYPLSVTKAGDGLEIDSEVEVALEPSTSLERRRSHASPPFRQRRRGRAHRPSSPPERYTYTLASQPGWPRSWPRRPTWGDPRLPRLSPQALLRTQTTFSSKVVS
jgi:hypothetical protein